jgi:hypothetical protein
LLECLDLNAQLDHGTHQGPLPSSAAESATGIDGGIGSSIGAHTGSRINGSPNASIVAKADASIGLSVLAIRFRRDGFGPGTQRLGLFLWRRRIGRQRRDGLPAGKLKGLEVEIDGLPDDVHVYIIVAVSKAVSDAADLAPILAGDLGIEIIPTVMEPVRGLAYALHAAHDGIDKHGAITITSRFDLIGSHLCDVVEDILKGTCAPCQNARTPSLSMARRMRCDRVASSTTSTERPRRSESRSWIASRRSNRERPCGAPGASVTATSTSELAVAFRRAVDPNMVACRTPSPLSSASCSLIVDMILSRSMGSNPS